MKIHAEQRSEKEGNKDKREKRYGKCGSEDNEFSFSPLWLIKINPNPWPSANELPDYLNKSESNEKPSVFPKAERLTKGKDFTLTSIEISPDGKTIAFTGQKPTTLSEIYQTPLANFKPVAVTNFTE